MSLYQLAREGATEELAAYLSESDSPAVRERAAEFLGDVGEPNKDVVGPLIATAQDDPEPVVRDAAVGALDQLGQKPLEQLIAQLADVDPGQAADWATAKQYQPLLTADRPELRLAAATVLGRLGGDNTVQALRSRFDDPDPRVRVRAVRACGQIGAKSAVGDLTELVTDADHASIRREAAEALGMIGDTRAVGSLSRTLEDPSSDVRRAAISSLGDLGDPDSIGSIVPLVDDTNEAVRQSAAFALIDLLASAPPDQSHEVRETIVDELRTVEQPVGVLEPLIDILRSGAQTRHRRNVAWLLGQIATEDPPAAVIDVLTDTLCSSEETIAQFAATSLVSVGGEDVESALIDIVTDETVEQTGRAKAAFALGKVGGERARKRLSELVEQTEEEAIRKRAFAALSKLRSGAPGAQPLGAGDENETSTTGGERQ